MKQIKYILAIAILAIFSVGCTDENEMENNKTNSINLKSGINEYDSRDHTYEIDYSDEEVFVIMEKFDKMMRGEAQVNDYSIQEAIFAMEFYYNYAVVDKQIEFDTTNYEATTFTFSVGLNENGNIDGNELREQFTLFLNNVISSMGNKYLQYSDLYLYDKTNSQITFGLEMASYHSGFPRNSIVRSNSDPVIVYGSNISNWNNIGFGNVDETVRALSKKVIYNYYFQGINTHVPHPWNIPVMFRICTVISDPFNSSDFIFQNDNLKNVLVYPTIERTNAWFTYLNRIAIDVWPRVYWEKLGESGLTGYMSISMAKNAVLMPFIMNDNFNRFVNDKLIFPIQ